ncbi:MAG: hypothetical protein FD152_262 [Xanthobacteraceae bacterium]|nr:MAG: hypothetical protein FD152_262 [Xanthobacteraceae bacterium]
MPVWVFPQPGCVIEAPSNQGIVDLVPWWISRLPDGLGVVAGTAALFDDPRATWAIEALGGVGGCRILELGPLEGGHTHMLLGADAAEVIAIEGNRQAYLRCLVAKELLDLKNARFLLGNFLPWLANSKECFDVIWATGVLDAMINPLALLAHMSLRTNRIHLFTHYIPDEGLADAQWAITIAEVENRAHRGRVVPHYMRAFPDASSTPNYASGLYTFGAWLRRADILEELNCLGFKRIAIGHESTDPANGPSMTIVASR